MDWGENASEGQWCARWTGQEDAGGALVEFMRKARAGVGGSRKIFFKTGGHV